MSNAFRKPTIIARSAWAAIDATAKAVPHAPARIVLHHTASPTAAEWKGPETLRAIQRYHMQKKGWADIAYHFVIDPFGNVYAGRDPGTVGAHCGGTPPEGAKRLFGNTGSVGICVVGNLDVEVPTGKAVNSLLSLIAWLQDTYGIRTSALFGHCEAWTVPPKSCPGKRLFTFMFGTDRSKRVFGEGA